MFPKHEAWNARNEMLNALESKIVKETHGRLRELSVEAVDGTLIVEASSGTYHAIQLALNAIRRWAAEYPHMGLLELALCVNGHSFTLREPFGVCTSGQTRSHFKSSVLSERLYYDPEDATRRR